MVDTVKIRVTSPLNINFSHVLDTGIPVDEWNELGSESHADVVTDLVFKEAIEWDVEHS